MSRWTILLALLLVPVLLHIYLHLVFSRRGVYDEIKLGAPEGEVETILYNAQVVCGPYRLGEISASLYYIQCHFRDPWRNYTIVLDSGTRRVVLKRVSYERVLLFPLRIFSLQIWHLES